MNNLKPGIYRFEVVARNRDGAWSQRATGVAFTIAPFFYQTRWFAGLAAASLVAAAAALFRLISVRRWKQHLRDLQEQRALEAERTRIAHDIHDELGANVSR